MASQPSPKKLRLYTPHVARHRSLSPPPDLDAGFNCTPLPGSSGMFLLIRNILNADKSGFGKPVELVNKAISEIIASEDGTELSDISVLVVAGGRPQDPHSSSAYLELAHEIKSLDTIPRDDLLTDWMKALKKSRPSWDIVWAPQKKGKDRRMVVRFRVAETKEKVPANASDKIRAHLESKGHKTIGGYISFNGLVDITLADTESVDRILASSYYVIPSLSKEGMHVSPPKFIPINYAFELCVGGLNDYEGIHETIEKWLYHRYAFIHDDGTRTPCVFDTRMSSDREYFIFTMDSWESTLLVLKDTDAFRAYFTRSPLLTDPKLLFELNSSGFIRKNLSSTIDAGAGLINDAISDIKRDLADFRKEQGENINVIQRQVTTLQSNMDNQVNAVALIGSQLQQFGMSLLAGRDEKAIEGRIYSLDSNIAFETQCLRSAEKDDEKVLFRANIAALQKERRELTALLAKASEVTMKLIGPVPGTSVPQLLANVPHPPTTQNAPPVTPRAQLTQSPARPPIAPRHHAPNPTPAQPDPQTPIRACRSTPTQSDLLYPPSNVTNPPLTPTPVASSLPFSMSPVATPTPAPRLTMSIKRNGASTAAETAAKRTKVSERTLMTRSESRGSMLTQSGNDITDAFGHEPRPTVCLSFVTGSTHLITAPDDQAEIVADQRHLTTSGPAIAKSSDETAQNDQMGRVYTTESLPRKTLCRRSFLNFKSHLLIAIIVVILSLIKTAAAAPSASGSLSFYALNTNGFVHPMKIEATNSAISFRNPDVFVITETKTNSPRSSKMAYTDYQIFEEQGIPVSGHHLYKWGVVLGIKKGIAVSQRVNASHSSLTGRLVAVDIVIRLNNGSGFTHRVIAAYAPWDVTDSSDTASFWSEAAKLCLASTHSWTLLGDLNATVTQAERKAGGTDARCHFNNFLRHSKGTDLWSNYPDRSRLNDWTCKSRHSTDGGSIIDRIVTSANGFLDSEIFVADGRADFIPMTDHRAVVGRIILKPPDRINSHCLHDVSAPVLNNARIKFPDSKGKHLFQEYRDLTDSKIREAGIDGLTVTDEVSFNDLYTKITNVINQSAVEVFGRIKRKHKTHKPITNQLIQQLQGRSRALGGALRLVNNPLSRVSHSATRTHALLSLEYSLTDTSSLSLRSYILAKRKIINKDLYRERSNETYARAKRFDSMRISQALAGGSTKRLVQSAEFIPLPMSINTIDGSGKLLTSPDSVKAETRRYWEKLYARQPVPAMEKPWLNTKSVKEVNARVSTNPFLWPREANLSDFRALTRKGNARPSPGPDGMEKWCVKSLSDFSLAPVLRLHNFMTLNSCFPGDTKDMYLTMFHKRGLRTDLNNWRGLMISNFIANSPMTWLNHLLTPFIATNSILPDTQVATQQGVQTRDLTSFLSGILTWANRHKKTIYALKRDQMKGFDYLAPEGFYDAIIAYGLPSAIIDIDKAAQTNTKVFIRTAHGLTDPIVVSGVAKQGGPISPLKSTLTTSMGHRYLDDVANQTEGALSISSSTHQRKDPHLPDDHLSLPIRMVEATDDSILFASSIPALQSFCLLEERFQFAYGWLTNWLKTTAFVLSPSGTQPDELTLPSITIQPGVSPLTITHHNVPLISNELEFLRVKIDNPSFRFHELQNFIEAFTFPKFVGPTPITLIRKITMQSIASRARALLTFQPIIDSDAIKLDRQVAAKVHTISGFPWVFNSDISTLPVSLHGFDFPSIRRINASIAVDGLARDLNHHIPAYRKLALITLADWTCQINECINPLSDPGINKDFTRRLHFHTIPAAWIVAQKHMGALKPPLRLLSTDQSHILNGDVSISHSLKLIKPHNDLSPSGSASYSLRMAGIRQINQLGSWRSINHVMTFAPFRYLHSKKLSTAAVSNWNKVATALNDSKLEWFFHGPIDLLTTPSQRRLDAENYIIALALTCKFSPSLLEHDNTYWATDGSMIPAASTISDPKSITAAVSGPASLIMRLTHRNASILQGEQMGLVSALVLAESSPQIYTDHMNSTLLIDDSRSAVNPELRLRSMNGRSYYRWILDLVSRKDATVTYTKAHTTDSSLPASLNREADHYASSSQKVIAHIPIAPMPTFFMDSYTFHREPDGWIESNIRYFIDHYLAKATADALAGLHKHRMKTWLYDPTPPPPWVYVKASSAYTALVQLYARSGQLPTAEGMFKKRASLSSLCRFGCPANEDPHHVFVLCPRFSDLRHKELDSLTSSLKRRLDDAVIDSSVHTRIIKLAKSLFSDSTLHWPLGSTSFFLGQIPDIEAYLQHPSLTNHLHRSRLIHNIASDMHLSSVRLASRIFGDLQKVISKRHADIYGNRK